MIGITEIEIQGEPKSNVNGKGFLPEIMGRKPDF